MLDGIDAAGNQSNQSTITVTNIDKILPIVAFGTNGSGNAETATTTVTVNDGLGSGVNLDTLQYVWDTQSNVSPTSGWNSFTNGEELTKNIDSMLFLWIKANDNVGNTLVTKSNIFFQAGSSNVARYLIVDINGKLASNCTTITEIQVYDNNNNLINYNLTDVYCYGGNNSYWTRGDVWGSINLKDNDLIYSSSGGTVFNYTATESCWTRFVIDLVEVKDIGKISLWAGSPEQRIPNSISIYSANAYTVADNLTGRSNTGLSLVGYQTFTLSNTSVVRYDYVF